MSLMFKQVKSGDKTILINLNNVTEVQSVSGSLSIFVHYTSGHCKEYSISLSELRNQLPDSLFL